ncbi:hypothetical protein AMAG_19018 [Allomyces macrogynus ATCC 38327]|uniref:DUF6604 domain-containing protein n=1 Tax=Allomyces macrogynus (strain ATCC 38327) TaxID=578462 RepID=A0A0L0SM63_ALLM3|nr:hypothetical protein AMAG_19018 [Allomyces macrogynus ATCC 38327]|eukprot:KNE63548.1 hypothetical protein AMAG_19018 [Allomyces macrogynus ATCC 38327]
MARNKSKYARRWRRHQETRASSCALPHASPQMEATGEDEDAKHAHFISVLEKVVEFLEPRCVASKRRVARQTASSSTLEPVSSDAKTLNNLFAVLSPFDDVDATSNDGDRDECDDVDAHELETVLETIGAPRRPAVRYQAERAAFETWFAIHKLSLELANIRHSLRETWAKYRDGKLDLITASLVTNTALDYA